MNGNSSGSDCRLLMAVVSATKGHNNVLRLMNSAMRMHDERISRLERRVAALDMTDKAETDAPASSTPKDIERIAVAIKLLRDLLPDLDAASNAADDAILDAIVVLRNSLYCAPLELADSLVIAGCQDVEFISQITGVEESKIFEFKGYVSR